MKTSANNKVDDPYITIDEAGAYSSNPPVSDFYMGATVLTGDLADQGVKVIWVDVPSKKLYLNKALTSAQAIVPNLDVLVDRPQITYGLKTKTEIVSSQGTAVRNRVQVYPTRLAVGSAATSGTSTVSVQLIKNPIFQTTSTYNDSNGTVKLTLQAPTDLKQEGQPTVLTLATTPTTFADGATAYGWIQAYFTDDSAQRRFTVFGLLRRVGTVYTFTAETSFDKPAKLVGSFLHAKNYDNDGSLVTTAPIESDIERLSSINIANELRTPIPGTGTQITTFFIGSGGFQFDLSPYFNYNKDYLSYPLTNKIDSLYLTSTSVDWYFNVVNGDPVTPTSSPTTGSRVLKSSVLTSITWEEQ
jgi:hypothetical protein